ncbi:DNA topoisomerase IB [Amycolatopsis arida]|uniref:DNA topoisomerase n=1 Tax=Amycolatopsis arida TaxID=587909 RepID=A0A1I5XHD0_9PSEU|nr:DNA topoisomerase IB [Amycolatopsis arida]TDX97451.1 DNA topoisomerase IB [Amycolatopsis arida]SFQ31354.1 DNA topoisomerase IB [Amycolatopsis arida]
MRLRRSDPNTSGIRRQRRGRGFRYLAADGTPVTDPELLRRIRGLVIPPAWRDVWICPHPAGHIQAVGVDDAGRRQYIYHEQWRRQRDVEKHQRVLDLARRLPRFRAAVKADLDAGGTGRNRVLAAALRMLDVGVFRTGGEEYAEDNGTHGAATLLREHVRKSGDELVFCYTAKGGIERTVRIRDADLAAVISTLRRARPPTDRLLAYRENGRWHEVHAEDINERFKELAGERFTAKDLRTWNATVLAATAFAETERPTSKRGRARAVTAVMREVAEELGNTPTVARKSYVDPRVVRAWEEGITIAPAVRRARGQVAAGGQDAPERMRATLERAVARMLARMDPEPDS